MLFTLAGPQQGRLFALDGASIWIGRSTQMSVSLDDDAVSSEHAHITCDPEGYRVVDASSRNGTYVNDQRVTGSCLLSDGDYLRFGNTILKFALIDELEENALNNLFELTVRDPLTRAFNRRYLTAHLRSELAFAARQHLAISLLLIDIDHFKRVNDTYGHSTGDLVLQRVATTIQRLLRPYDALCRYGGEEFVVIVRDTAARDAELLAQRIRRQVEGTQFEAGASSTTITVSIGVTTVYPDSEDCEIDVLLRTVDAALYEAKQGGRNQVQISHLPPRVASGQPSHRALHTDAPAAPDVPAASEGLEPLECPSPRLPSFD